MSKNKKILLMVAKGGYSQSEIAASLHVSKRDVSAAAKVLVGHGLRYDDIAGMDPADIDGKYFPKRERKANDAYLHPDMAALVARKRLNRKLTVKLMWMEHCAAASDRGKLAYSYQTFCSMFAEEAERSGATRHFVHEPGAKAYIDWAGDTAWLTDKVTGTRTKAYVIVVVLPFSGRFWAEGFCDMRQRSWQLGQEHAFEDFGGVPRMLVPDNCATATDRSAARVTLVNHEYERFAEHYGAAVYPARVRKPRDKSAAESTVDLVEKWVIAPANEMTFYTLEEFNAFCTERTAWLNSRPFSAKEGSRTSVFGAEEAPFLLPLPADRYEGCEWRTAKAAPDYHVKWEEVHFTWNGQLGQMHSPA